MKLLEKALADGSFVLDLKARNMASVCHQTLNHLIARGQLAVDRRDEVERELLARERQISTAIGHALAVPHVYLDVFEKPLIVFVRLARPLNLGAPDGIPVRFVFLLLGPPGSTVEHLDTLAAIARLMSDDEFRYRAGEARSGEELLEALRDFRRRMAPPADEIAAVEVSEGLQYTGRPLGGIIGDLKRRLPHFVSDFTDGLHSKSISSTLFLFFACLAPAVTFGGIMAEKTGNQIGAVEMIAASAVCGVIYALFSGQPLVILGGTGPLLVFTIMLFQICDTKHLNIEFLPTYSWVGLWTAAILLVIAAADSSCLMRFFTRFTDEIFAALISIIFISASLESIIHVFREVYDHEGVVEHDTAFLTLLLALGTYYIATNLSRFRRSRYLLPQMREFLADFGPAISLCAMTLVALWLRRTAPAGKELELAALAVPDTFQPTFTQGGIPRSWLVDLFAVDRWVWFAAIGPALLVAVLVYVDQNITARLVNSRDHKLQKGETYHYDLALIGILIGVCSLFGLPWLVAATVRSLNHVRSLATTEEVVLSGGTTRDRILHVRETRITGLAIHLLIGLSLLLLPLLKIVPMAVLYGLFLYMGIVSMAGNQFFERLSLWLMDRSLYPATHYIRRVPNLTMHCFTLVQFLCLAVLLFVEVSALAIFFPLFIVLLVPVRLLMGRFFAPQHLAALDAEEDPEEEETQWV